jgi:hypothetical protein
MFHDLVDERTGRFMGNDTWMRHHLPYCVAQRKDGWAGPERPAGCGRRRAQGTWFMWRRWQCPSAYLVPLRINATWRFGAKSLSPNRELMGLLSFLGFLPSV